MTFWSCPVRLVKHQFKNTLKQNHCPPNTSFSFYHFVWLKFRPNSTGNRICVLGTETKTINNVITECLMEPRTKPQQNFDSNCCWSVLMLLMTQMTCSQCTHTHTLAGFTEKNNLKNLPKEGNGKNTIALLVKLLLSDWSDDWKLSGCSPAPYQPCDFSETAGVLEELRSVYFHFLSWCVCVTEVWRATQETQLSVGDLPRSNDVPFFG